MAEKILGFNEIEENIKQGTGQITTFNQLGIIGKKDKPDGWYLPENKNDVAIILETKNSNVDLDGSDCIYEIKKNCSIVMDAGWSKVVGVLYNGKNVTCLLNNEFIEVSEKLENKRYYINIVNSKRIDKERIYSITKRINDSLHIDFGIKNLYHRMIFTACALVSERYGATLKAVKNLGYSVFKNRIFDTLSKSLEESKSQNQKIDVLLDTYSTIRMNVTDNQNAINQFIDNVCEISECINSNDWRGEDVMGIFFNEFNRYKAKSESGQIFTPEHITDFMFKLLDVNENDVVGDFCCGSGGFLVKSMSNMMRMAGGYDSERSKNIRQNQLYGIEFDREVYALACANMMIHKDGKSNIELMDARSKAAGDWIKSKPITKVLMNPPYENKYGCLEIVLNVLNNVERGTECAFILPDKKLERGTKKQKKSLKRHKLTKIIKLPDNVFKIGLTTSIFVFKAKEPQGENEIFCCRIESDGLDSVKNKGRHDVREKWDDVEKYWIDSIKKLNDLKYGTTQWIKPSEKLSYQLKEEDSELTHSDFWKKVLEYIVYEKGIDYDKLCRELTGFFMRCNWSDVSCIFPFFKEINPVSGYMHTELGEFRIGDLFEKLTLKCRKENFNKLTDCSEIENDEFSLPLVNARHFTNGIQFYGRKNEWENEKMTIDIVSNGAISTGDVYAQPQPTGVLWDAYLIKCKHDIKSKHVLLYLACVIEKCIKKHYGYDNKCTWNKIKTRTIRLPIDSNNKLDWEYMEQYIKNISIDLECRLNIISKCIDLSK